MEFLHLLENFNTFKWVSTATAPADGDLNDLLTSSDTYSGAPTTIGGIYKRTGIEFAMNKVVWGIFLLGTLLSVNCRSIVSSDSTHNTNFITPDKYVRLLGTGRNVDWAKTSQGISNYNARAVIDFKRKGLGHVRIRVKNNADQMSGAIP